MVLGLMPQTAVPAFAANEQPSMQFGTSVICHNHNTSEAPTVWYADQPWRVVGYDGQENGVASINGAATLLSADILDYTHFYESNNENSNFYANSLLRKKIEGYYTEEGDRVPGVLDSFSKAEREAIKTRTLVHGTYQWEKTDCIGGDEDLTDTLLWPLSAKEALELQENLRVVDPANSTSAITYWWLRSPGGVNYYVGGVAGNGWVNYSGFFAHGNEGEPYGVRPAFYLDLNSVIFTSAAQGGKSTNVGTLEAVGATEGNSWKLTLPDSSRRDFTIEIVKPNGNDLNICYRNAISGQNEYISAIVTDSSGTIIYYGKLGQVSHTSDTVSIHGADIWNPEDGDKLFVFNEKCNGNGTDYSSELIEIKESMYDTSGWSGSGTKKDPFVISDKMSWNYLTEYVAEGKSTLNRYFSLGEDIVVDQMLGTADNPFKGSFDGAGHILEFNAIGFSEGTAPFRYIDGADIRNLHVTGTITGSNQRASGLIGENSGSSTVTNCKVSVTISGSKYIAGFCIGAGDELTISACVFDGQINGSDQSGGFVAWGNSGLHIYDSIFDPKSDSTISGGTFYYNGGGTAELYYCLYTKEIGTAQGKKAHSIKADSGINIDFGNCTYYTLTKIVIYDDVLEYKNVFYAGKDDVIDLTMPDVSTLRKEYVSNAGELTGSGTNYTLVMPDEDVVISTKDISVNDNPDDDNSVNDNSVNDNPAKKVSIEKANVVLSETAFTYNGKIQKPVIKTIKGLALIAGTDYTEDWSNASSRNAGTYTVTITGKGRYTGTAKAVYTIGKAPNPMKVKPRVATVKYRKLKKKTQTIKRAKAIKVSKAQGKLFYKFVSVNKSSFKKYFKINAKTGNVIVKKGLKKGIYRVKVKVRAAGNTNYKASAWKKVAFKVQVK